MRGGELFRIIKLKSVCLLVAFCLFPDSQQGPPKPHLERQRPGDTYGSLTFEWVIILSLQQLETNGKDTLLLQVADHKATEPLAKIRASEEERHHLQKVLEGCTPMGQPSPRQTTELEPSSAPGLSSSPGDSALAGLPLGSRKSTRLHQLCYSGHGAGWGPLQTAALTCLE